MLLLNKCCIKNTRIILLTVLTVLFSAISVLSYASGMYSVSGQNPEVPAEVFEGELPAPNFQYVEKPDIIERFIYGSEGRTAEAKASKISAAIITVLLGPFGAHRVYLGTHVKVPIIYTLTLGGGFGILPLIDLAVMLISDDLGRYTDNEKVIMWINPK